MAGSMKDIKLRIKSVESTMQITKAMELVASSKMRRAKERVEHSRPYFETLHDTLTGIAAADPRAAAPTCAGQRSNAPCWLSLQATAAWPVDITPTCSSRRRPSRARSRCCPLAKEVRSTLPTTGPTCSPKRCCWRRMSRWVSALPSPGRSPRAT
ncbi:putative ATP synthase F1, gamma subunit [Faecalibacterium duncaniae]|uniref:ATP synthase F1, gamma subunit n=1 Tax=Faecalibacterium duncaniae (strain DSM 17677 / JCM 31915 / A2-165) TaxID=411483 RepID=C7H352_FAED2|nr:putative ATP synthase F1, gamma subunit [Faecalibacterium duncaniae]